MALSGHPPERERRHAAASVARRFAVPGAIVAVDPLAGGHINDSYRVLVRATGGEASYLLQRVNPNVFPRGEWVMENVLHVTRHIAARLRAAGITDWERRTLTLLPAHDGTWWWRDPDGAYWRMYRCIMDTYARDAARTPSDAREAGRAFGTFLRLVANYDGLPLHETIPGFHDTPARFRALDDAVRADACHRAARAAGEIEHAQDARALAGVLPPLLESGELPRRIAHNDAKIANVLFDSATADAICVVDLDTVMPGSALYDFADLVRSTVSPAAEDEPALSRITIRTPVFEALAAGYLEAAGDVLTPLERSLLVIAARVITLEQAVRFLTDYLNGDRYYRITRAGQNLDRARAQLRLFELLSEREAELTAYITSLAPPPAPPAAPSRPSRPHRP